MKSAFARAREAQAKWARTPVKQRLQLLRALRARIAEDALHLARTSAFGRSRPALESLTSEVLPLAEAALFLERHAGAILTSRRLGKSGLPFWLRGVRTEVHREPLGVVLIIGPGNYPLLLPGVQLLQALVAGNAVVVKPGASGAPAAKALCDLLVGSGFEPDLVVLLDESAESARAAIAARPDKVLFTGAATTGEIILKELAPHLIPATMELSGCDALIVCDDADLDLAASAVRFGLGLNGGATCLAPRRLFVSAARVAEVEGRLARLCNGASWEEAARQRQSRISPVAHAALRSVVNEALAQGAHLIAGAVPAEGPLLAPLILGGIAPFAPILTAEIFAPLLLIVTVADEQEAIQRANNCPFALGASVFSRDEARARFLASRINAGVVTINDLIIPTADARAPFGGRARSGFGTTRGAEGLLELTAPKVVTATRGKWRPALDTPRTDDAPLFEAYLRLRHGHGWTARLRALGNLASGLFGRINSLHQERT